MNAEHKRYRPRERRKLLEVTRPANLNRIHNRFHLLIDKLRVWSRDPEAVTTLRHMMKLYRIQAHWDADGQRWYRSCEIEYDFEAMVRVLGKKK